MKLNVDNGKFIMEITYDELYKLGTNPKDQSSVSTVIERRVRPLLSQGLTSRIEVTYIGRRIRIEGKFEEFGKCAFYFSNIDSVIGYCNTIEKKDGNLYKCGNMFVLEFCPTREDVVKSYEFSYDGADRDDGSRILWMKDAINKLSGVLV